MGRPYQTELGQLGTTYDWALGVDIDQLASAIRGVTNSPLAAVGSGGSLTVAEFAVQLHERHCGILSRAHTPLSAVDSPINYRDSVVFMATASGRNPDVLGSFRRLAEKEPRRLIVLCLARDSPVARLAARQPIVDVVEMVPPVRRDGFLATNSLVASVVLLLRAYAQAFGAATGLPRLWTGLLPRRAELRLAKALRPAWDRQTQVVLHGASSRIAALDLESKFSEAALGNLWTADYRHFAHGRHHWLAKRADSTAVLAFAGPSDQDLAERTLSLIPETVHTVREDIPFSGPVGEIAALARVMHIVGLSGQAVDIDPGRPSVPSFGRRIYHLNAFRASNKQSGLPSAEVLAIERKACLSLDRLKTAARLDLWRAAYRRFCKRLADARFTGVVFDYDGTLCGKEDRFGTLRTDVALELARLLDAGLTVGVASGRGKSIRLALRQAIREAHWERVVVGYYNGADLGRLSDREPPDASEQPDEALRTLAAEIRAHQVLARSSTIEIRRSQLTVTGMREADTNELWSALQELVHRHAIPGVSAVRSNHSFDVLAPNVNKRTVVKQVAEDGLSDGVILCIGDRGAYPGNDHLLLSESYALSVDEVSVDPDTCWNLAPPGTRWVDACVAYMRRLTVSRAEARFL